MEESKDQIIKKLRKEIRELKSLAARDHLTGVLNRRGFLEELEVYLSEVNYSQKHRHTRRDFGFKDLSIAFVDVDNLKKINDACGHDAGDIVLKQLVLFIQKRVRKIDLVGRWGGDEFVVALVGSDEFNAYRKMESVRKYFEAKMLNLDHKKIKVGISIGVVSAKKSSTTDAKRLINLADHAMYRAKTKGQKNCTIRHSSA